MPLSPLFKLRETATPDLIRLLESVTLGTNGAKYRHLDTRTRIQTADNPLHLTLERNNRALGNITFCRRDGRWYIRYFAFETQLQGRAQRKSGGNGFLKRELHTFFEETLNGSGTHGNAESFYAYIDPNNEKSLWMSESFGFESIGQLATQTFSRNKTRKFTRVEKTDDWSSIQTVVRTHFSQYAYYFEEQVGRGNYFVLRDASGEIEACAKITPARWEIERLPGKMGGLFTKILSKAAFMHHLINPKNHTFLVPEAVFVKNNDPALLTELFEGILTLEKKHLMIWWVDERDGLYAAVRNRMQWGVFHKLVGVNKVAVVERRATPRNTKESRPIYTSGFDFV